MPACLHFFYGRCLVMEVAAVKEAQRVTAVFLPAMKPTKYNCAVVYGALRSEPSHLKENMSALCLTFLHVNTTNCGTEEFKDLQQSSVT